MNIHRAAEALAETPANQAQEQTAADYQAQSRRLQESAGESVGGIAGPSVDVAASLSPVGTAPRLSHDLGLEMMMKMYFDIGHIRESLTYNSDAGSRDAVDLIDRLAAEVARLAGREKALTKLVELRTNDSNESGAVERLAVDRARDGDRYTALRPRVRHVAL